MGKSNEPINFWSVVNRRGPNECWPWTKKLNGSGYGSFSIGGISRGAHIWAYVLTYPKRKFGPCYLHTCDNRACCNPFHIFRGTHSDNSRDAWLKGINIFQIKPELRPKGEKHKNAKLTSSQVKKIREMYAAGGINQYELGTKFGVTQPVIRLVVNGLAYKDCGGPVTKHNNSRNRYVRGQDNANSKTTDEDAQMIQALYATGKWKQKPLGKKFGISQAQVSKIVIGLRKTATY